MDIERERGITIKSQAVTIPFKSKDGNTYKLDLVDTSKIFFIPDLFAAR